MQSPQERSLVQSQSEQQIPEPTHEDISRVADDFERQIQQEGEYPELLACLLKEANQERKLLRSILEKITQERSLPQSQVSALQGELEKAKQERSHLQSQVSALQGELERVKEERSLIQSQMEQIQTRLETLEQNSRVISLENSSSNFVVVEPPEVETATAHQYTQTPEINSLQAPAQLNLTSEESHLVATYNQNPDNLLKYATEVSETEESIGERRLGRSQRAVLEKARRGKGNYWIITAQERKYLVPKGKLKINEHNYQTVEALFKCQEYQPGYSSDFKLRKPGRVSTISSGEKWELVEPGVLQF